MPRHREPARQHHVRRAIAILAGNDHEIVFRHYLAEPRRAMRQRRQRLQVAAKTTRLLKAHRSGGLIACPRQFAEQRPTTPAQKTYRATHSFAVSVDVDTHVARRGAATHLAIDARREILVRIQLAGARAQSEDSRERTNRMLDAA